MSQEFLDRKTYQVHIAKPDGTTVRLMLEGDGTFTVDQVTAIGLDPGMTLYP